MGEIAFENGRISDFQGFVTLTLTLDQVILHTVMHQLWNRSAKVRAEVHIRWYTRTHACNFADRFHNYLFMSLSSKRAINTSSIYGGTRLDSKWPISQFFSASPCRLPPHWERSTSELTAVLAEVSVLQARVYLGRTLSGGLASTTSIRAPSNVVPEHVQLSAK